MGQHGGGGGLDPGRLHISLDELRGPAPLVGPRNDAQGQKAGELSPISVARFDALLSRLLGRLPLRGEGVPLRGALFGQGRELRRLLGQGPPRPGLFLGRGPALVRPHRGVVLFERVHVHAAEIKPRGRRVQGLGRQRRRNDREVGDLEIRSRSAGRRLGKRRQARAHFAGGPSHHRAFLADQFRRLIAAPQSGLQGSRRITQQIPGRHRRFCLVGRPTPEPAEHQIAECRLGNAGQRPRELIALGRGQHHHARVLRARCADGHERLKAGRDGRPVLAEAGKARVQYHLDGPGPAPSQRVQEFLALDAASFKALRLLLDVHSEQEPILAVSARRTVADEDEPKRSVRARAVRHLAGGVQDLVARRVLVGQELHILRGHAERFGEVLVPLPGIGLGAGHSGHREIILDAHHHGRVALPAAHGLSGPRQVRPRRLLRRAHGRGEQENARQ